MKNCKCEKINLFSDELVGFLLDYVTNQSHPNI